MGKIGDLFVRLGLKADDYKKGIEKAKDGTKDFSSSLSKMKASAVAIWAAVGASVIAFGNQMLETTNRLGDAWNRFTAASKASWDVFLQSLSNFDFRDFIGRIREATVAAVALQNALDSEYEVSNSVRLQKAAMAEELAALEILARNVAKPYELRKQAAEEYLRKVKPLYDQELALAKRLEDAHVGNWLAGSGIQDTEQTRKDLRKFLVDYGKDQELADKIGQLLTQAKNVKDWEKYMLSNPYGSQANSMYESALAAYNETSKWLEDYGKANGYSVSPGKLGHVYENMRADKDTTPLVDAMIRAGEAAAAFDHETKRMQQALNQVTKQLDGGGTGEDDALTADGLKAVRAEMEALPPVMTEIVAQAEQLQAPDIFKGQWLEGEMDALKTFGDGMTDFASRMEQALEDCARVAEYSLVSAASSGIQALTDLMFNMDDMDSSNIAAAFLMPIADAVKHMGEIIMAAGVGMLSFQNIFKNPAAAIAAGAAMIAIGSIAASALQSAINKAGSAGSYGNASAGAGSSGVNNVQNYESSLTVEIVGELKGADIVLAAKKTQDRWNR